jgi:hypothetical protein
MSYIKKETRIWVVIVKMKMEVLSLLNNNEPSKN